MQVWSIANASGKSPPAAVAISDEMDGRALRRSERIAQSRRRRRSEWCVTGRINVRLGRKNQAAKTAPYGALLGRHLRVLLLFCAGRRPIDFPSPGRCPGEPDYLKRDQNYTVGWVEVVDCLVGLANRQSVEMRCVTHWSRGKRPKPHQTLGLLDPPYTSRIASQNGFSAGWEHAPRGMGEVADGKAGPLVDAGGRGKGTWLVAMGIENGGYQGLRIPNKTGAGTSQRRDLVILSRNGSEPVPVLLGIVTNPLCLTRCGSLVWRREVQIRLDPGRRGEVP
jgi:hypothetical protein